MRDDMETKRCFNCGRELPVTEFYKNNRSRDGYQSWCKECLNHYPRSKREKSREYREKINLEPIKKDIMIYARTHTYNEIVEWLDRKYHIQCGKTLIGTRMTRWKKEAEQEVKDMHKDGASYREIEDKTGISKSTAQRIVNGKKKPAEIPVKVEEYIAKPVIELPLPAALVDYDDAALIAELRKRGYRVFSERYIKRWGNHYKKQLIEITQ